MKHLLLLISFSFALSVNGQKKMVLIEGFKEVNKEISSDSIAQSTYDEFILYVDKHNVNYQGKLKELKCIRVQSMNKVRLWFYYQGTLYINSYLDQFPHIKRVVVLKGIGLVYNIPLEKHSGLGVMNKYLLANEYNESKYIYRRKYLIDLKKLTWYLEESYPLIPKKNKR